MFGSPPVVVQKKRGMGCFGIGCVILIIALALVAGLIGVLSYLGVSKVGSVTSAAPAATQTFDGGDQLYETTEQKLSDFQQSQQQGKAASIELTADELNTLIARDSDFTNNHIRAFITMTGNRARIDASFPTNLVPLPFGLFKDQYVNATADFSPSFDPATKDLTFKLHTLKIGSESVPASELGTLEMQLNPIINAQLHMSPNTQSVLDRAQAIEVRDGKLEIQMR